MCAIFFAAGLGTRIFGSGETSACFRKVRAPTGSLSLFFPLHAYRSFARIKLKLLSNGSLLAQIHFSCISTRQ